MKNLNATQVAYYNSPIGRLEIRGTDSHILSVLFAEGETSSSGATTDVLEECIRQLDQYFHGTRQQFELPLLPQGTPFQQSVWKQLQKIPFGATSSYRDVAKAIGNPAAVRAVGLANGRNPITIIIPCHRVIGSNGKLVGYGGGLWRKEWLLKHEQNIVL